MAKENLSERRKRRNRFAIKSKANGKARICVERTNKHIKVQLIDDLKGVTLASASTLEKDLKLAGTSNIKAAETVGKLIAERAKKAKVSDVVFDRGANIYHGRVKALAEAARKSGLKF